MTSTSRLGSRRWTAVLVAPVAALATLAGVPAAHAAVTPVTSTFNYTGGAQSFTVPDGVTSVTLGASGGAGANRRSSGDPVSGGRGGTTSGTFTVTPGEVLSVLVAGDGGTNTSCTVAYDQACGGYGYGKGGDAFGGAGGGGASAVVAHGTALVVAGGGGGAAESNDSQCAYPGVRGGQGGAAGQPGSPGGSCSPNYAGGAGGQEGTQTGPGAGGARTNVDNTTCGDRVAAGASGIGHNGGSWNSAASTPRYSGGGGGGWYGGGQGADGCVRAAPGGGGGGSNHYDDSASNPVTGVSGRTWGQNGIVTISYALPSDTTPPVITPSVDGAAPKPTTDWYTNSPKVTFEVSESDSAITSRTGCADTTVTSDGAGQSFTCTATSLGGPASETVTINRDSTAPTASFGTIGVTDGGSYTWGTTPAAPTCEATDATSGPDGCTVTGYSTAIGSHTLTATAKDKAGNTNTATLNYIVTDATAPVITSHVSPPEPDGANGWYKKAPVVSFDVADPESAPTTDGTSCKDKTVTTDGAGQSFTCTASSLGGTASKTVTINRDGTAPSATFGTTGVTAGGSYTWGTTPAAPTCEAADATSGPDGCTVTGYSTAVGTHTLTATAKDKAGNTSTLTRTYTVSAWATSGFFQPVDMGGVVNTVKGGSTVPVKFTVKAGTTPVTDPSKVGSFTATKIACGASAPTDAVEVTTTDATSLRYDATAGQFIYNWKTPKTPGTCYQLTLTTADGTKTNALFNLK